MTAREDREVTSPPAQGEGFLLSAQTEPLLGIPNAHRGEFILVIKTHWSGGKLMFGNNLSSEGSAVLRITWKPRMRHERSPRSPLLPRRARDRSLQGNHGKLPLPFEWRDVLASAAHGPKLNGETARRRPVPTRCSFQGSGRPHPPSTPGTANSPLWPVLRG